MHSTKYNFLKDEELVRMIDSQVDAGTTDPLLAEAVNRLAYYVERKVTADEYHAEQYRGH